MPYATIDSPNKHFDTTTYTANGGSQTITNSGSMQPDFFWGKVRSTTSNHILINSIVGVSKYLYSNTTASEVTDANYFTSFNSNGFSVGSNNYSNGTTMVAWQWKGGGTGVSNTSGTISSTVSANTTSGFSIVSYTGNGTSGATVGHGIGSTVGMILVKGRSFVDNWAVYHKSIGGTGLLELNGTGGTNTVSTRWNNTNAGATVFTLGNNSQVNGSGSTYIAYCFAEVKGFSKFGSYTGNGNADGTFVYTGFKPAFLIVKRYNDAGYDWLMYDNKRQVEFNVVDDFLKPNLSDAETTGNANQSLDFLSNGVKFRGSGASSNGSGASYIYMAFAENPFVSSKGIPTTAR